MTLELLALPLADANTALAVIGTKDKGELFRLPVAYDTITTEGVLGAIAELQAKVDKLAEIERDCQPKLVAAGANVVVGGFGGTKH